MLSNNIYNLRRQRGLSQEQLAEALDVKLPTDEEYVTLGGLIYAQLSTIPKDGQQFDVSCHGLSIHVDEVKEHRVEWATIRVEKPEEEQESKA